MPSMGCTSQYYPSTAFLPSVALGALLTPNSISCDSGALAAHPQKNTKGCTFLYYPLVFSFAVHHYLHHSDKKLGCGVGRAFDENDENDETTKRRSDKDDETEVADNIFCSSVRPLVCLSETKQR